MTRNGSGGKCLQRNPAAGLSNASFQSKLFMHKALSQLEHLLPFDQPVNDEQWMEASAVAAETLWGLSSKLLGAARATFPKRIFVESKQEVLVTREPAIVVAEFRLRPQSSYYNKTAQEVPRPENPKGNDATGIQVGLLLCRRHAIRHRLHGPYLSVEFSVWGKRERASFQEFFSGHRRFIERLLNDSELRFRTSTPFANVERFRGTNAFRKMDLYFENEFDPEHSFTLERTVDSTGTSEELTQALASLTALYDCAVGYCNVKKNRDRALDYSTWISSNQSCAKDL